MLFTAKLHRTLWILLIIVLYLCTTNSWSAQKTLAKHHQVETKSALSEIVLCSQISDTIDGPNNNEAPLKVAVASNFYYPLMQLVQRSNQWSTNKLTIIKGSSGTLFAQISKGAPFDVFLSADTARPQALFKEGLATCVQDYVQGKLALWPYNESNKTLNAQIDAFLQQASQRQNIKFAIANPQLAPYGQAAVNVLKQIKVHKNIKAHLVLGANVTQAFQFLDSGNAKLGIVSESVLIQAHQVFADEKYLDYYVIPESLYSSVLQQAVVLKGSKQQKLAREFIAFLVTNNSQNQLVSLGYKSIYTQSRL